MRRMFTLASLALLAAGCGVAQKDVSTTKAEPTVVEFRILAGTGTGAWNKQEEMVMLEMGDTLRIFNDDTIHHRLHTNGKPCGHGDEILPGASSDCVVTRLYDPGTDGVLYDHYVGPSAQFWIKAVPQTNDD